MNYDNYADKEIDMAVAKAEGFEAIQFSASNTGPQWVIKEPMGDDWMPAKIPDYCNNPSDAWPIIVDNNISVQHWDDYTRASTAPSNDDIIFHDEPAKRGLRAAMIVYLMLKEKDI